jgi:hypothetical protein
MQLAQDQSWLGFDWDGDNDEPVVVEKEEQEVPFFIMSPIPDLDAFCDCLDVNCN